MSPFVFPDPNVTSTVTNPNTGEVWIFSNGAWVVDNPEVSIPEMDASIVSLKLISDISILRDEIESLKDDIIDLRAEIASATSNNFLILE